MFQQAWWEPSFLVVWSHHATYMSVCNTISLVDLSSSVTSLPNLIISLTVFHLWQYLFNFEIMYDCSLLLPHPN